MPVFIMLSIALSTLVQTGVSLPIALNSSLIITIGVALAVSCIILNYFKKLPQSICYDLFASGTLVAWFVYWKPLFKEDSPIFFFFPLYFALFASFVTLFLSGQRQQFDDQSLQQMQKIADKSRLKPWFVMICVLASLELQEHYLLYPVLMTLLILRFALFSCLERK